MVAANGSAKLLPMNRLCQEARRAFIEHFGEPEGLVYVRAPGCVNLIGDHTDFYGGFALPVAVDLNTILAFRPNDSDEVRIRSVFFNQTASFRLDDLKPDEEFDWIDYVQGSAGELGRHGVELRGFDAVLSGSLPVGVGLGSSSALTVAASMAFVHLAGVELDRMEIAQLCHHAETEFVGVQSGLVDPVACLLGQKNSAIKIDCTSLEVEFVPIHVSDANLVICDSKVRSENVWNEINRRREQCRDGMRQIAKVVRGREIDSLCDISLSDFNLYGPMLQEPIQQRIKHVVTENQRVVECAESLLDRNIMRAGVLLDASHVSLRDDYEVSCKELDLLTEIAWNTRHVYGARMTGLGFGGATINMVEGEGVRSFCQVMASEYKTRMETTPNIYVCNTEMGAEILTEEKGT